MRNIYYLISLFVWISLIGCSQKVHQLDTKIIHTSPIIIDHSTTITDLKQIPSEYISKAKSELGISYGHTSHGSQITSGMKELMYEDSRYSFGPSGSKNVLTLYDHEPAGDLSSPTRREWERRTRQMLDSGWGDVNIVVWAWCWGVSDASETDIQLYLDLMQGLEDDYPGIVFVYMTGHLDGTGLEGNLHQRNVSGDLKMYLERRFENV